MPIRGACSLRSDVEAELDRLERGSYTYADDLAAVEAALAQARETRDDLPVARALGLLARAQIERGQYAPAVESARSALASFDRIEVARSERYPGVRAELLRVAGLALFKAGRIGEALPVYEDAVHAAERGVRRSASSSTEGCRSAHALVRSLTNLGTALTTVGELDSAVAVYDRSARTADANDASDGMVDEALQARWKLIDALHERVRRSRTAGDEARASADLDAVRTLLDGAEKRLAQSEGDGPRRVSGYGRQGYYGSLAHYLLLTGRPAEAPALFERQIEAVAAEPASGMADWVVGIARAGMAQALLALGRPGEALRQSALALERFDRYDDAHLRARVLLTRATAMRALGAHEAAYAELEAYHTLRGRLEAAAAQHYARHLTAKFGIERARAEAEWHHRTAATLETLGRIGQEITANRDTEAVIAVLRRHIGKLVDASAFTMWLLDAAGLELTLAFGVEDDRPLAQTAIPLGHPYSWVARAVRDRCDLIGAVNDPGVEATGIIAGTRMMQTAIFAPLMLGDRVLGALSLQSDRPNAYTDNERWILRTLCTYVAIALDNAAAYRDLCTAVATLQQTQRELAMRTAEYERLSMTDPLTGVANRRHFIERAAIEIAEVRRSSGTLAVALFDIDHFKSINDRYGHVVGDRVLQRLAHVARDGLRSGDFLARIGGEEFALLLPGAKLAEAIGIAERMRAAVEKLIVPEERDLRVTASFGVANFVAGADTFDDAFARADSALYRAKQAGRNRVRAVVETEERPPVEE